MLLGEVPHWFDEIIVEKLGESFCPNRGGCPEFWGRCRSPARGAGAQIVATAFLELVEKIFGPVFAGAFKAVAEDGVGRIGATGGNFLFGDGCDESLHGGGVLMVQNISLGPERGAFDFHPGMAGYEIGDSLRRLRCGNPG